MGERTIKEQLKCMTNGGSWNEFNRQLS